MELTFGQTKDDSNGTFYLGGNGLLAAKVYFSINPHGFYVLEHTETHPSYKGQGKGEQLISEIVLLARRENKSVILSCSFAKRIFEKHPEWNDVL
jgi:predicted GNAT family acetyltransferase